MNDADDIRADDVVSAVVECAAAAWVTDNVAHLVSAYVAEIPHYDTLDEEAKIAITLAMCTAEEVLAALAIHERRQASDALLTTEDIAYAVEAAIDYLNLAEPDARAALLRVFPHINPARIDIALDSHR